MADMLQVIAATEMLEQADGDEPRMLAAETAIAVCYARAFTSSNLYRLSRDEYRPKDPEFAALHDALYELRDIKYAHTDPPADATRDLLGRLCRRRGRRSSC